MVLGWESNIDLQLASAGSEEAVRERVHVSVFSVFLHKAVVFSPEKKGQRHIPTSHSMCEHVDISHSEFDALKMRRPINTINTNPLREM